MHLGLFADCLFEAAFPSAVDLELAEFCGLGADELRTVVILGQG